MCIRDSSRTAAPMRTEKAMVMLKVMETTLRTVAMSFFP